MKPTIHPILGAFLLALATPAFALVSGEHATGTISPATEIDTFTFEAVKGGNIRIGIRELPGQSFDPKIELFAPSGGSLSSKISSEATGLALQAPETGTYTIEVSDYQSNHSGGYDLNLAVFPSTFAPIGDNGPLMNGLEQAGFCDPGDFDLWSFEADRGDQIQIGIRDVDGAGLAPAIELFDPRGQLIAADSDGNAAFIQAAAPGTGTYIVAVSDLGSGAYEDSGNYELSLGIAPQPFDMSGDSGVLVNGGSVSGTILPGELDLWSFDAQRGDPIRLAMGQITGNSSFSPVLELFDPNGLALAAEYHPDNSHVETSALIDGTYTVVARDAYADAEGTYRLSLTLPNTQFTPTGDSGILANGDQQDGALDPGDHDIWSFQADKGDSIHVALHKLSGSGTQYLRLELFDSAGTLLGEIGQNSTISRIANTTGTYSAVVRESHAGGPSTYRIALAIPPRPFAFTGDSGELSAGSPVAGTIDFGDMDMWWISAVAGDNINISLDDTEATSFWPRVQLYAPDGRYLTLATDTSDGAGSVATINHLVGTTGAYCLIIRDGNSIPSFGSYQLEATGFTGSPVGAP